MLDGRKTCKACLLFISNLYINYDRIIIGESMTKIQDIDFAIAETMRIHPNFIYNSQEKRYTIPDILYQGAFNYLNPKYITSTNNARNMIRNVTANDFIEYIIKNAVLIYSTYNELMRQSFENANAFNSPISKSQAEQMNSDFYQLRQMFQNIDAIRKQISIISNPDINVYTYYQTNANALFDLAYAVGMTRFNPRWYTNNYGDQYNEGRDFRNKIDSIGNRVASPLLSKIDRDMSIFRNVTDFDANPKAVNRCLNEVLDGSQVRYARNEYALDGTLYASQDVGLKRSNQEDSVIILTHPDNPNFKFLAVADGMGGLEKGEVASNYVIKEITKWFRSIPADAYYFTDGLQDRFNRELNRISYDIYQQFNANSSRIKAGSTFVGAIVTKEQTIISNIGDSRAYTVNQNGINLVSTDDSKVWMEMLQKAQSRPITMQDIDNLRYDGTNNVISKCMGMADLGRVNTYAINNSSYDTLLLLTDGITDLLSSEDIKFISQTTPKEYITKVLVERALSQPLRDARGYEVVSAGKDNATAAMFRR